jgi:hypothetical protein
MPVSVHLWVSLDVDAANPKRRSMIRNIVMPLLLAAASGANAQPVPISPGSGFDVERYAVSIRPDLATTAVSGMEAIVLRATSDRVARLCQTNVAGRAGGWYRRPYAPQITSAPAQSVSPVQLVP